MNNAEESKQSIFTLAKTLAVENTFSKDLFKIYNKIMISNGCILLTLTQFKYEK